MLDNGLLKKELQALGIQEGDTVFVRGNLGKLGRMKPRSLFLDTLLDIVSTEGTVVTLGFSKIFPFYRVDKQYVFDKDSLSTSGALAKSFMQHLDCQRSMHPSNSFLAIGKEAEYILEGHNAYSLSYTPMQKIINLKAKMLIFGIIDDSPGFTTVHYVQEVLGLTHKSWLKGLFKVYYRQEGETMLFTRRDIGGCSAGFDTFYKYYLNAGVVKIGSLGNTQAMVVPAIGAYEIEYKLIKENPSVHFCNNILCFSCRVSWKYDFKYIPTFFILKFIAILKGLLK